MPRQYNIDMAVSPAEARRWVAQFEAAASADRREKRRQGPRPEQSIALALSLLNAARVAAGGRPLVDPTRDERDNAVRATWIRLRSRMQR